MDQLAVTNGEKVAPVQRLSRSCLYNPSGPSLHDPSQRNRSDLAGRPFVHGYGTQGSQSRLSFRGQDPVSSTEASPSNIYALSLACDVLPHVELQVRGTVLSESAY
ncbi:hypothetical protein PC119_g13661 [Phytophthora cactorum]|nr:hypothetical protein PC114_g14533 [Phytophthora cactorum]KAG3010105.1 hypothetical protein PC119_g13661 [Phytophthora cactorum]